MRRFFACCSILAVLFSSSVMAQELKVVTTVKPLGLIVQALTDGAAQTDILLPPGTSPHDYALRPSDMQKLNEADLVIWVGPELETFLVKVLAEKSQNLALTAQASIDLHHYEEPGVVDHGDHSHSHDGVDPHVWLGPVQAIQAAKVISGQLVKLDPLNKKAYDDNLAQFVAAVEQITTALRQQLKPLGDRGYYVFHDAYGYFEQTFALNKLGHFTVNPDRRPGAKTLVSIRRALKAEEAVCVFSEPQFSPAVVKSVVRGTKVHISTLDPMATEIAEGKQGYVQFLTELGQSFTNCLK
ncbi:zinc ABC transporter substrate-binding protein ZnuA [Photobacterium sp. TY1-4]|uniref:zinc ABC transporter substrate-binding protein ZnuA n=1 Tax=Photobacterium sp. TY1-4 TaxID=2899122 RepID=UPI0021BEB02E|nr:zinc ABC transporter substrate-binding protein ZnuA [Photobacterium sp. TY1-4]UXI02092.1 zinc ABC transporter substrate-binding protein ZnuA [Photobacterium sp. TY1-4]